MSADINAHRHIYVTDISEPKVNTLRLVIEPAPVPKSDADPDHPIDTAGFTDSYEVLFPSYIAYSVRNESFTVADSEEVFNGRLFVEYSRSKFLDFIESATIASEDHPGPFRHFGINALDHIIDVASIDNPIIRQVRSTVGSRLAG